MFDRGLEQFGEVSLVQIQPQGLIIETAGSMSVDHVYDASRRVEVDRLIISSRGVEATLRDGSRVLDIHHLDHPQKAYDDDDLVCIGFTSHYQAMRNEFGRHMVGGVAGENIVIDCPDEVWPDDLGKKLMIENQDTGVMAELQMVRFSSPCVEFGRFCMMQPQAHVPSREIADVLRFLGRGRRGFLFVLEDSGSEVTVRPGDKVFRTVG